MIAAANLCLSLLASAPAVDRIGAARAGEYSRILTIPVLVDGKGPFRFFVDTGATTTTVSASFARKLGVEVSGTAKATGATGAIGASPITFPTVTVGSHTLTDLKAVAADNFETLHRIAPDVVGSLGLNALRHFTLVMDFTTDTVALTDERLGDAGIPLRTERGSYVEATINGKGPYTMYLDTGAEVNMISSALARELALRTFEGTPMTGAGGSGVQPVLEAVVRSFVVGGVERTDTVASISDEIATLSHAARVPFEGIVGYPIFGGRCAAFDFVGGRAVF